MKGKGFHYAHISILLLTVVDITLRAVHVRNVDVQSDFSIPAHRGLKLTRCWHLSFDLWCLVIRLYSFDVSVGLYHASLVLCCTSARTNVWWWIGVVIINLGYCVMVSLNSHHRSCCNLRIGCECGTGCGLHDGVEVLAFSLQSLEDVLSKPSLALSPDRSLEIVLTNRRDGHVHCTARSSQTNTIVLGIAGLTEWRDVSWIHFWN